jgi:hypothetical protein
MSRPITARTRKANVAAPQSRVAVFVLGPYRAGLRDAVRMFTRFGCALSKSPVGATPADAVGFGDSPEVLRLNDRLLTTLDSRWDSCLPFGTDWLQSPIADTMQNEARAILRSEYADEALFVIKDPRMCRTANLWFDACAAEAIVPVVAIGLCDPERLAAALVAQDRISREQALLLWVRLMLDAERQSRGRKRVVLALPVSPADWPDLARACAAGFGIIWPVQPRILAAASTLAAKDQDPAPETGSAERGSVPRLPIRWVPQVYEILSGWQQHSERVNNAEDHARLDSISAEFDAASEVFAPLMLERDRAVSKVEAQASQLAGSQVLVRKMAKAEAEAAQLFGLSKRQEADLNHVRGHLADREAAIASAEALVRDYEADLVTAGTELAAREAALAEAAEAALRQDIELSRARDVNSVREQQLLQMAETLRRREEDLVNAGSELAARGAALAEAAEAALRQDVELSRARDAISDREQQLVQMAETLRRREEDLVNAGSELAARGAALAEAAEAALRQDVELSRARDAISDREQQLVQMAETLRRHEAELADAGRVLVSRECELQQANAELASALEDVGQLETALNQRQEEAVLAWDSLKALEAQMAHQADAAIESDRQFAMISDRLHESERALSEARLVAVRERSEAQRLEADLKQANADMLLGREAIGQLESSVSQRREEADQAWARVKAVEAQIARLEDAAIDWGRQRASMTSRLDEAERALSEAHLASRRDQLDVERLKAALQHADDQFAQLQALRDRDGRLLVDVQGRLNEVVRTASERTDEIVMMTRILRDSERSAQIAGENGQWLAAVMRLLNRRPVLWSLMPKSWVQERVAVALEREGLFNSKDYLECNPDVARAGYSAIDHYVSHGMAEGRLRPQRSTPT